VSSSLRVSQTFSTASYLWQIPSLRRQPVRLSGRDAGWR